MIDGMGLLGIGIVMELVVWFNGYFDFNDLLVDFSYECVVIIGNGNVVFDVVCVFVVDLYELVVIDIVDYVLFVLCNLVVCEVVVVVCCGFVYLVFILFELIGFMVGVDVVFDLGDYQ